MAKRKSLADSVAAETKAKPVVAKDSTQSIEPVQSSPTPKSNVQKSRRGKQHFGGYFSKECVNAVKMLGLELDLNIQQMVAQAMNDYLEKHGKPPVFPVDN
ncbi:MAG: ribbon-helix-helix domain-containing protein [Cyanobacteria bacterium P01_B01_bin.77]